MDNQQYQQRSYNQNNYQNNNGLEEYEKPLSIGSWIITYLLLCIPIVNIVMIFVYAFSGENKTRQNFFKAYLIVALVIIVIMVIIWLILFLVFGVSIFALFSQSGTY